MSDVIISVERLGKKYRLRHQGEGPRYTALRDVLAEKVRRLFSRNHRLNDGNPATGRDHACLGREPGVVQPPWPWTLARES